MGRAAPGSQRACPVKVSERNKMPGRVLIIGSFLGNAPLERYIGGDLSIRLAAQGWQVRVTSKKINRGFRLLDMLQSVYRHSKEYDVALVEVYSGWAFFWAEVVCAALRLLRKPYVLALYGGNLPRFSQRAPVRMRRLLGSAQKVICPSAYFARQLQHVGTAIEILPYGFDLPRYHFRCRTKPCPTLVWLRAFHEIYNPTLAVETLAILSRQWPDASLQMAGPDKDGTLEQTRRRAAQLGVAGGVTFLGRVAKPEVPGVLAAGDIFLNTTNADGMPVSVLEALATGLCVVSTDVGGLPDLLKHEHDSLLVRPREATLMANAVTRSLAEPGLAERLSRNARAKAEQFGWSSVLPKWLELLSGIGNGEINKAASLPV